MPMPKMAVRATFFARGSCSCHSSGMGNMIIARSVMRLMMPTASYACVALPHVPSMDLSQVYAIGRQSTTASMKTAMLYEMLKNIIV